MTSIDLGWPAFCSLLLISVLCGIAILIVFRRWSDQRAIQRSRSLIVAYLLEFRLFINEPSLVLRAQRNLVRENLRLIRLLLRPALIVTIPMLIFFEPLDALYRYAPIRLGESAIVTIQSNRADDPHLHSPDEILVETPPVHIPREHQLSWRVRALRPVAARVEIVWPDRILQKRVVASAGGIHFLFTRSRFLFDNDVNWFEIRYPAATVLRLHWLVWFSVLSTSTVLLLNTCTNRFGRE